jgi:hypothetical protein
VNLVPEPSTERFGFTTLFVGNRALCGDARFSDIQGGDVPGEFDKFVKR